MRAHARPRLGNTLGRNVMASPETIRNELLEAFAGKVQDTGDLKDARYLVDYVAMAAALSEGIENPALMKAFLHLEQDMIDSTGYWFNEASKATNHLKAKKEHFDKGAKAIPSQKPKDTDASKLLTKALSKFELAHGFVAPHKLPNYAGFVFGHVFTEGLNAGMHWKDVGAGPRHGEFTHRIQWYVLIRAGILTTVAKNQEALVFKSIAPWQKGKTNLWTFLCDRAEKDAESDNDFRCPEKLNTWLTGDTAPDFCPLLRLFLQARMSKRATYDFIEYISRKTKLSRAKVEALAQPLPGWNASARLVYDNGKATISNFAKGKEVARPTL
jgi:hypothetical protein